MHRLSKYDPIHLHVGTHIYFLHIGHSDTQYLRYKNSIHKCTDALKSMLRCVQLGRVQSSSSDPSAQSRCASQRSHGGRHRGRPLLHCHMELGQATVRINVSIAKSICKIANSISIYDINAQLVSSRLTERWYRWMSNNNCFILWQESQKAVIRHL